MATRAERRDKRGKAIKRRVTIMKNYDFPTEVMSSLAKHAVIDKCSNMHCSLCSVKRSMKKMSKKRERLKGRKEETV